MTARITIYTIALQKKVCSGAWRRLTWVITTGTMMLAMALVADSLTPCWSLQHCEFVCLMRSLCAACLPWATHAHQAVANVPGRSSVPLIVQEQHCLVVPFTHVHAALGCDKSSHWQPSISALCKLCSSKLALVAGCQDCQPWAVCLRIFFSSFQVSTFFAMTIHTASQMQFNASNSPTQPCLTTYYTCTVPWSKHFTRLCKWVHPWEPVSEIRSVQETLLQLCLRQLMLKTRKQQACIVTSCVTFAQKAGQGFAFKSMTPDTQGCDILTCDTIYLCGTHISWYAESCKERTTTHW